MKPNTNPLCNGTTYQLYNETFLANPTTSDPVQYSQLFLSVFFFVFGLTHSFVSLSLFIILHSNQQVPRIWVRSTLLVALSSCAISLQAFISFFPGFAAPIPSFIVLPGVFMIFALSLVPIPIRLLNFYGRYLFSQVVATVNIYQNSTLDVVSSSDDIENPTTTASSLNGEMKREAMPASKVAQASSRALSPSISSIKDITTTVGDYDKGKNVSRRRLLLLKFFASPRAQFVALIIALLPLVFAIITNFALIPALAPSAYCYGVLTLRSNVIVISVYGALTILLSIYVGLSVRKFTDPFGIATETRLIIQYGGLLAFFGYILDTVVTNVPSPIIFDYFTATGEHIMLFFAADYQIYLAVVERYSSFSFKQLLTLVIESLPCKRVTKENKITSEAIANAEFTQAESTDSRFIETLHNPKEVDDFEKFLIGELSAENLRMYVECRRWELTFYDMTDSQRRARAKKIVELFVDIGSLFEVNLPSDIRIEIVRKHDNKDVELTPELFARSQLEMLGILYGAYQRYTKKKEKESR